MYYILVMTTAGAALDKCHNACVNEGFEAWRQFVMEWEPKLRTRYVGLLMNVLVYRFRDDIPTKLAAYERTVHDCENQSTKTVDDDINMGVTMLGMEDVRVKEHLIRNSVKITSWTQMREEIRRSREHNSTSTANRCQCSSERIRRARARAKTAKAKAKARTSRAKARARMQRTNRPKKAKNDDQRRCFYCNKSGHLKAECRKKLRDLADAEGKPVAATPHPNGTAAVVPLQCLLPDEKHTSTFVIAIQRPGAGSIAPAETQHVRPIAAVPSNETYLMMDTCAGASIFPRGFDQSATDDSTVQPVQLSTATDDRVRGDAGKKSCFGLRDGREFQVQYNEADVSFPIVSIGEASHQGTWFVFGPGCQAMLLSSSGEFLWSCVKDPNAAKFEKHRGVYWLPCSATEHTDRAPLCPNPRAARIAVEAPPISVPDPHATPMQLEESKETCRPKHRALPANVSKEECDAHQFTHLPFRSWCDHCVRGKAVDDAHRPRIDPHKGEAKMGVDHFFLARATNLHHACSLLSHGGETR